MERHIYSIVFENLADQEFLSAAQAMVVLPWEIHSYSPCVNLFFNIPQLMEKGFDISLAFFDLGKTFNSVHHLPLLYKLEDIGLNQHILQWIAS